MITLVSIIKYEALKSQDALDIDGREGVDLLPFCKPLLQTGHMTCPGMDLPSFSLSSDPDGEMAQ